MKLIRTLIDKLLASRSDTWRCPGCWESWSVSTECRNCGSDHPGLYRHPPVDPITGEVSAADDSILMGEMRHCDVPVRHRRDDCTAIMHEHGYSRGRTLCPPTSDRLAETDQQGVDFGSNCVHITQCRSHNQCFGTCKLY